MAKSKKSKSRHRPTTAELVEKRKRHQIQYIHRAKFDKYIKDVLKNLSADASISQQAVEIVDSVLKTTFEDVGDAVKQMLIKNQKRTLDERDMEHAVKVVLPPGELLRHALAVGSQAVTVFKEVVTAGSN